MNGVKDAGDVLAVAVEDFRVGVRGSTGNERPRHLHVALAQRNDRIVNRLLSLGLGDERQEPVGDAPARRQDDTKARTLFVLEDVGDAEMSEPGFSGANVFLIQIGIRFSTAGAIVCGWITFAPK